MREELAEVFSRGLTIGGHVATHGWDERLVGEELEDDAEDRTVASGDDGEELGCRPVNGSGEGSEGKGDGLNGDGLFVR